MERNEHARNGPFLGGLPSPLPRRPDGRRGCSRAHIPLASNQGSGAPDLAQSTSALQGAHRAPRQASAAPQRPFAPRSLISEGAAARATARGAALCGKAPTGRAAPAIKSISRSRHGESRVAAEWVEWVGARTRGARAVDAPQSDTRNLLRAAPAQGRGEVCEVVRAQRGPPERSHRRRERERRRRGGSIPVAGRAALPALPHHPRTPRPAPRTRPQAHVPGHNGAARYPDLNSRMATWPR